MVTFREDANICAKFHDLVYFWGITTSGKDEQMNELAYSQYFLDGGWNDVWIEVNHREERWCLKSLGKMFERT